MPNLQQLYTPTHQQDEFTEALMGPDFGFIVAKRLDDGTYVGITKLMFTWGLCIGITTHTAYTKRFCYEDASECLHQYVKLAQVDQEPIGWIARRPEPADFYAPSIDRGSP